MRMSWFRMYHESRNDRKLDTLADDEFRVWHRLLCFASEQEERGVIRYDDRFLLAIEVARGDEELLSRAVTRCVALRMIADDGHAITFLNFDKRNYDKPSDRPEQTRERKRKSRATTQETEADGEKSHEVTPRHAQEKIRGEKNREDKRREKENEDTSTASALPAPAVSTPAPPVRLSRHPPDAGFDDWWERYPRKQGKSEARTAWRRKGLTPEDVPRLVTAVERQTFSSNWQKEGGRFIPMPATWLNQERWDDEIEVELPRAAPVSDKTLRSLAALKATREAR